MSNKKTFVEYLQRDSKTHKDKIISGFFELITDSPRVKIRTQTGNIITIPEHRLLLIKNKIMEISNNEYSNK